jgi:hypothetical protein
VGIVQTDTRLLQVLMFARSCALAELLLFSLDLRVRTEVMLALTFLAMILTDLPCSISAQLRVSDEESVWVDAVVEALPIELANKPGWSVTSTEPLE